MTPKDNVFVYSKSGNELQTYCAIIRFITNRLLCAQKITVLAFRSFFDFSFKEKFKLKAVINAKIPNGITKKDWSVDPKN